MLTRIVVSIDAWQRRHALGGFPVAVLKKFREDRASSLAVLGAYYAFFSLFPLLLVFVSILGFVLDDDPSLRDDVVDTALDRIPVIGAQLRDAVHPLTGSGVALAVGLVGALVIGLLSWFYLAAHLLLVAAEVNVVRRWRLWPRSLTGELEPADRRAMQRFAQATRQDERARIVVSFGDAGDDPRTR